MGWFSGIHRLAWNRGWDVMDNPVLGDRSLTSKCIPSCVVVSRQYSEPESTKLSDNWCLAATDGSLASLEIRYTSHQHTPTARRVDVGPLGLR
jgi:hypothetical protein